MYLLRGLADLLFPPRCLTCDNPPARDGTGPFCLECFSRIAFIGEPLCPRCGTPHGQWDGENHLCGDCITSPPPFSIARALGRYESTLMDAIHRFKYGKHTACGDALGAFMAARRYHDLAVGDCDLIIPVPLHPAKLRERGFNQALILARHIAASCAVPVDFMAFRRLQPTEAQVTLSRDARRKNVAGAFAVRKADVVDGKKILLVDDVYTTGSTVRECARTLLRGGAAEVRVLTLARA